MAPTNISDNSHEAVEIFITAIMKAKAFDPDWAAVAEALNINTSQNAQRTFKRAVEKSGKYECKKSIISLKSTTTPSVDVDVNTSPSTPTKKGATPKKRKSPAKKADAATNKKSKKEVEEEDSVSQEDFDQANEDCD